MVPTLERYEAAGTVDEALQLLARDRELCLRVLFGVDDDRLLGERSVAPWGGRDGHRHLRPLRRRRLSAGAYELRVVREPRTGERRDARALLQTLPGHEVKVNDEEGETLPVGHVGRLLFRGPSSMEGYHRRPNLTREAVCTLLWAAVTVGGEDSGTGGDAGALPV